MTQRWRPTPLDLVSEAVSWDYAQQGKGPKLAVYHYVWSKLSEGHQPTEREVARATGWSRKGARPTIRRAADDFTAWENGGELTENECPKNPHRVPTDAPPIPHPSTDDIGFVEDRVPTESPPSPHQGAHARVPYCSTTTPYTATLPHSPQGGKGEGQQQEQGEERQRGPGYASAWGKMPQTVDRTAYAELTLRVIEAITGSAPDPRRCKTDARRVWGLARSQDWPEPETFEADVMLVIRASKECPHPLFARDIRAEGWERGIDRSAYVGTICTQSRFGDRLREAKRWRDGLHEGLDGSTRERDDVWRYLRSEAAQGTEELFADDPHLTPRAIAALAACGGSRALLGDIARGVKGDSLGFAWRSWKDAWAGAVSAAATTEATDAARAARRTG